MTQGGNESLNYQEPYWSWPAYAGTTVGGTTNLTNLHTRAVNQVWSATPGPATSDVTCTLTSAYNKPLTGLYTEFPMKYLSGGHWYQVDNGAAGETYDVSGSTRMTQVYTDLSAGQANKAVRVYQSAGTDTTAPTGSILINGGASATTNRNVTLTLSASDGQSGVGQMMISNSSSFSGASWEAYRTSRPWTLSDGTGAKRVYVKFRDRAMPPNEVTKSATITYTEGPEAGAHVISVSPSAVDASLHAGNYNITILGQNTNFTQGTSRATFSYAGGGWGSGIMVNSSQVVSPSQLNANGGHDVVGATSPEPTFYFAEGTGRPGFDPYICIQNPGSSDADVTITYMKGDGTTDNQKVTVGKNSRATVKVKDTLGEGNDSAHDFSTKVECTNGQSIIAERPMYFNYGGAWTGGHDVVGFTP